LAEFETQHVFAHLLGVVAAGQVKGVTVKRAGVSPATSADSTAADAAEAGEVSPSF